MYMYVRYTYLLVPTVTPICSLTKSGEMWVIVGGSGYLWRIHPMKSENDSFIGVKVGNKV